MSEQRGFGNTRGRGRGRGDKRGGRGGRGGRPQGGRNEQRWRPLTKLGRMVNSGQIKSLEEIFKFSMPIKEVEIVDKLIGESENYKEEVMKVKPIQKQTTAGQRTRFKVWVLIGDGNGHIGLGQKAHKEVQGAIKGAIRDAKMNILPVRMGYWGNNIAKPHTIPMKISGKEFSKTPSPTFGINTWRDDFDAEQKLFDKRYKPPDDLEYMPSYPPRYSVTGDFLENGPLASNATLN